jgi:hypothetical protein
MIRHVALFAPFALGLSFVHAANDATSDAQNDVADTPQHTPIARWTFDDAVAGTWAGTPKIDAQGPQTPMFPNMPKGNKAAYFSGKDSALTVKESDLPGANLRFKKGDAITIEAWVNVDSLKEGAFVYLVGKGRNKKKEFLPENQNYALRLKNEGGEARVCFLFRTESEKFDSNVDYHRWTSDEGFAAGSGWHHAAASFVFGKADSIAAFVDGKKITKGKWDMGGKSDKPPVNDADDLVIGTGNGGGAGNTLRGWLDEVALYREVLPDAVLAQRYQFVPPPPVVDARTLPKGRVRVDICEEGIPEKTAWPAFPPGPTESYEEDVFGIFDIPHKYVDTGVRGDRSNPYVLRAAANVKLAAGRHRILLRARNAARLYVDGRQVLALPFMTSDSSGHGHVTEQDKFLDLGPDLRFAPPGTQEVAGEIAVSRTGGPPVGVSGSQPVTE